MGNVLLMKFVHVILDSQEKIVKLNLHQIVHHYLIVMLEEHVKEEMFAHVVQGGLVLHVKPKYLIVLH